jgi:glycine betaine/choline ABC-type transport system substrate-binding protein
MNFSRQGLFPALGDGPVPIQALGAPRQATKRLTESMSTSKACSRTLSPTPASSTYAIGVLDGTACRKRGEAISTLRRVVNDEYSAGFRAGYFERAYSPFR